MEFWHLFLKVKPIHSELADIHIKNDDLDRILSDEDACLNQRQIPPSQSNRLYSPCLKIEEMEIVGQQLEILANQIPLR